MANPDSGVRFQEQGNTPTPTPYKIQEFNADDYKNRILNSQFNGGASKKDQRRFNKYINSDAGKKALLDAEQRHNDSEQATVRAFNNAAALANKYKTEFSKIGQETAAYGQNYWNENKDELQKQGWSYTPDANSAWGGKWSKQTPSAPVSAPESVKPALTPKVDWNAKATQYGFKDIDAVKAWQAENGLVADGKFGKNSLAKYNEIAKANQAAAAAEAAKAATEVTANQPVNTKPTAPTKTPWTHSVKPAVAPANVTFDWDTFVSANGLKTETVDGKKYALYDPWGMGEFKIDQNGHVYDHRNGAGWLKVTNDNLDITPKTSAYWNKSNYKELMSMMSRYIKRNKQGGTMNKIKYFQQGGAAPQQQDMQQQVVALVQAAMQGDQKAKQTVTKIMEAAEKGDQQAAQIAQMIQQVIQQMQGQATAAKWGAKLRYIRSLKFANGGKACPACQTGAPIKKVEEKACGGKAKKAKKRYFGGWL